jgi:hypothetical protein
LDGEGAVGEVDGWSAGGRFVGEDGWNGVSEGVRAIEGRREVAGGGRRTVGRRLGAGVRGDG